MMGTLADSDNGIEHIEENQNPSFTISDTQPFDSLIFPGENGGDVNGVPLVQSSLPFNDTIPAEDAFETQVLDLCGETQVLDDPDCLEHVETQLIDEFIIDGEGSDKTEVLDDEDDLCDGESHRRGLDSFVESPVVKVSKELKPVSPPRFISVRATSFRASGLAAHRKSLEGTITKSSPLLTCNQYPEEKAIQNNGSKMSKDSDQVPDEGRNAEVVKGLKNGSSCELGCRAMRKLFEEECENEGFASTNNEDVGDKEMIQLPTGDDRFIELSYIDSQEPGELSQANALACVERLIEDNKVLFDSKFDLEKSSKGKSNFISTAKGPQSLAKKVTDRGTNRKTGVFDWDDGLEDEGGGDIFCRRKEEFLGGYVGQKSFPPLRTAKGKELEGHRDNREKSEMQNEKIIHSDSKFVLHSFKIKDKTERDPEFSIRKNLANEFDEQSNRATSPSQMEADLPGKDRAEVLNVGLDTQMAAEAMEELFNGHKIANSASSDVMGNFKDSLKGSQGRKSLKSCRSKQESLRKDYDVGVATRSSGRKKSASASSSEQPSILQLKHSEILSVGCNSDLVMTRSKSAKLDADVLLTKRTDVVDKVPSKMAEGPTENGCRGTALTASCSDKKRKLLGELATTAPIACRTRKAFVPSEFKTSEDNCHGKEINCPVGVGAINKTKAGTINEAAKVLDAKGKSSELIFSKSGELKNFKSKSTTMSSSISVPKSRRSNRWLSGQLNKPCELTTQSKPSNKQVNVEKSASTHKRSRTAKTITLADLRRKRTPTVCPDLNSLHQNFNEELVPQSVEKSVSSDAPHNSSSYNVTSICKDHMARKEIKLPEGQTNICSPLFSDHEVPSNNLPKETTKQSKSECVSPVNIKTPVNAVSPVCVGDESLKQTCKRKLSRSCLMKEINSLCTTSLQPISSPMDLRRRRDLANVRVMFSNHLDENVIKQQRKIVDRLKIFTASSITDATHFIADEFVRTRNMLEAIASGKPVVTHLWLENVGRAKYYIDEQKYILRDTKKEKEIGFNLPISLAHARQHPLLEGQRVLITPNTKPGKEIISGLVKAVSGQAVERVGRSALKDDLIPDDLLILSCEEDYEVCVPFLEKGAAVYSSELLLNGIVTQKLEYERHQLFSDHVKRTRSTIWLKRGGDHFIPVTKHK